MWYLLASAEPVSSGDVATIWAWIMGSLAAVAITISWLVYRFHRHDQKLEERKLAMEERAEERRFIHGQLGDE